MAGSVAPRTGCSLKAWGVLGLILIAFGGALWPVFRAVRDAGRRTQRRNSMMQVGLALHNFHDVYRRFPPAVRRDKAGRPLSSWRFQLMPYLEAWMLDVDFGEHSYDAETRWCFDLGCYCWNAHTDFPECGHTNVTAITGEGTAFEIGKETRLSDIDRDTILVMEVAESDTLWMEPGDLSLDDIDQDTLRGPDGSGVFVLFADARVWFLPAATPVEDLKKFLTIEGAKKYDRERVLNRLEN